MLRHRVILSYGTASIMANYFGLRKRSVVSDPGLHEGRLLIIDGQSAYPAISIEAGRQVDVETADALSWFQNGRTAAV